MIEFKDFSFYYPNCKIPSLDKINVIIEEGEFLVITGPSGGGKSTFLRSINGLIPNFYGGKISGEVLVKGKNVSKTPTNQMSEIVGMVFQDPENQLVSNQVEREIAFGMENLCFSKEIMKKRIEESLDAVNISRLRDKTIQELSGGEKQKVAIASALATHPEVLLLDEPTSELDPGSAESVLNVIEKINDELGLTIILVEHRLERVIHHVDRMLMIDSGKILYDGSPRKLKSNNVKDWKVGMPPVTRLALNFEKEMVNNGMPLTVKEARLSLKEVLTTPKNKITWEKKESSKRVTLSMDKVFFSYDGEKDVLKDISFNVFEGDMIALMGKNASGKTTLVKLMNGLIKPRKGKILLFGKKISDYSLEELIQKVGIVFQDPNLHLFNDTVQKEVEFVLRNLKVDENLIKKKTEEILKYFKIYQYKDSYPHDLSGGERQRVALASVLVSDPEILILDEPTRGMDYYLKRELISYLREKAKTAIMITHDIETAAEFSDRVILLSEGNIISDGNKRDVLSKALLFSPQINRLIQPYVKFGIPDDTLTVEEALEVIG
ncbi:MAG: ABC transporter ATP-binding protein [Candidatus Methanofastidiosa archaeon]|jgi:energy-coupling factor transporter ATP-binding protein EcfA2|nr:ABC transporter ATP-binding protein [Candidatus Methanofastidiosa archaeon]HOM95329.1 energy-coupling factor transporter ATPase [Methanofastidiosum sp.]HRS25084.1 energy-coupling factor transporter ATPase [Methanofastidiosum sp.]